MRIGLVLEGGAMRGMYTAAILDCLIDENIKIDGIIGVSAGALFGINYCSKQKGRVLRYNKKYIKDPRYTSLRSLITTGDIVNKKFAYYELPFKLDVFDQETFSKSKVDFYAVMTDIKTGKPEYKKIINAQVQIEELRASGSMPYVSKPVEIDKNKYLDGALSDSIPILKMKDMGYEKIIVVLTRPIEYRKKKGNQLIPKILYHKYPNLVKAINTRYIKYNETLDLIIDMENKQEIFVFRPSVDLHIKRIEKDPQKLQAMYDLGIKDFKEKISKLKEYLNN